VYISTSAYYACDGEAYCRLVYHNNQATKILENYKRYGCTKYLYKVFNTIEQAKDPTSKVYNDLLKIFQKIDIKLD